MIEFTPDSYIIGLWYLELPVAKTTFRIGGNILCAVWRDDESLPWQVRVRTRMYRTLEMSAAELVKSVDEFRWQGFQIMATEEAMIANIESLFANLEENADGNLHEWFEVRGGLDRMHAIAAAGEGPHWFHMTSMPAEDVGKAGGQAR